MLYLYCPRKSDSARALTDKVVELGGAIRRIKQRMPKIVTGDTVVNWGANMAVALSHAGKIVNPTVWHDKYIQLLKFTEAGVSTPKYSLKPFKDCLVRLKHHQEANDLLADLREGDYYTQFVPFAKEFRVHIWGDKSFRAGIKQPRTGNPHPRFRSWNAGWKLDYGTSCQDSITNEVRSQAKKAVAALNYDFGAVDVGLDKEGRAWVLEVNSAPGLEGHTIEAYARKLLTLCK